jgi:hypothetical protein
MADPNFYGRFSVSQTAFTERTTVIPFSTQGVMFLNEGTGVVQYSFNGSTVHGELDSTKASIGKVFDNRVISEIWFCVKSGSTGPITVSVEAWQVR